MRECCEEVRVAAVAKAAAAMARIALERPEDFETLPGYRHLLARWTELVGELEPV